ncbi:MAG: 4-alpha-glucanotransferase, partial [Sphingobium sp.]
ATDRAADRPFLWQAIGQGQPQPPPEAASTVVDAAIAHIARAQSTLAIVPVEDLLGLGEQINLPGTTEGHPNWQRRLPDSIDTLLAEPAPQSRIATLNKARPK